MRSEEMIDWLIKRVYEEIVSEGEDDKCTLELRENDKRESRRESVRGSEKRNFVYMRFGIDKNDREKLRTEVIQSPDIWAYRTKKECGVFEIITVISPNEVFESLKSVSGSIRPYMWLIIDDIVDNTEYGVWNRGIWDRVDERMRKRGKRE